MFRACVHYFNSLISLDNTEKVEADPNASESLKSAAKMVRLILYVKSYTFDAMKVPIILQVGDAYIY